MIDRIYETYLEALLQGQHRHCRSLVNQLLEKDIPVKELYTHLFQRSLYEVGDLWEHNKITVATEHLATAITERMMIEAYPRLFSQKYSGKVAVVACPADEYHQIGAQMVADVFELNGWHGFFLGANTPLKDLVDTIAEKQPHLLALSISVSFNFGKLFDVIHFLQDRFSDLQILVGGQAFRWGNRDTIQQFQGVRYLSDLTSLEQTILSA